MKIINIDLIASRFSRYVYVIEINRLKDAYVVNMFDANVHA